MPRKDHLDGKFRKIWRWRPKRIVGKQDQWYNREVQQGGTTLIAAGNAAEYMHERGEDKGGLARWTWMKFEGRSYIKMAIIQVYRPVYNKTGLGLYTNSNKAESKIGRKY